VVEKTAYLTLNIIMKARISGQLQLADEQERARVR
jgi:hypothetical protein